MLNKLSDFLSAFVAEPAPGGVRDEHTLQLATAVLLVEVMRADADVDPAEQAALQEILRERFALDEGEVAQLAELGERTARDATDLHQFTSLINRELDVDEKVRIVEYMWRLAWADERISAHENHLMRRLADLLHIPHARHVEAKQRARMAAAANGDGDGDDA